MGQDLTEEILIVDISNLIRRATRSGRQPRYCCRQDREAIAQLYEAAADRYSSDASCPGCLVTEGARAADPEARSIALRFGGQMVEAIQAALTSRAPDQAATLTDVVVTTLRGFSAAAHAGMPPERLRVVAQFSGQLLSRQLDHSE